MTNPETYRDFQATVQAYRQLLDQATRDLQRDFKRLCLRRWVWKVVDQELKAGTGYEFGDHPPPSAKFCWLEVTGITGEHIEITVAVTMWGTADLHLPLSILTGEQTLEGWFQARRYE